MVSWDTPARVLLPHRLAAFTQTAVAHYKGHLHHHHEIRFDFVSFSLYSMEYFSFFFLFSSLFILHNI